MSKKCAVCGKPLESGVVVHSECVPRWIPVTERLPDRELAEWAGLFPDGNIEPFEVIVHITGAKVATTLYYYDGKFFTGDGDLYPVSEWMPLPEPPEVE